MNPATSTYPATAAFIEQHGVLAREAPTGGNQAWPAEWIAWDATNRAPTDLPLRPADAGHGRTEPEAIQHLRTKLEPQPQSSPEN